MTRIIIILFFILLQHNCYAKHTGQDSKKVSKKTEYKNQILDSQRCTSLFSLFEAKYSIPKNLLHSIALQESGRRYSSEIFIPSPWAVNVEGKGFFFDTKQEAITFVRRELKSGKESIDTGCMQVNLKYHPTAFKSLDEAFDPRANVEYAAQLLRGHYDNLGNWKKAVAYYHSATHEHGSKYQASVMEIAANIHKYKITTQAKNILIPGMPLYTANYKPLITEEKRKRLRSSLMVYVPHKGQNKS